MKKKEKYILGGILILIGTIGNLYFSAALHYMLSGENDTLAFIPVLKCINSLLTQRQQLLLFLSFEGFIVLCTILFFIQNSRPYQSDLMKVTEDILTPVPVGQYQHGSARWLNEREKDKVFRYVELNPANKLINELLKSGYDNMLFLKEETEGLGADELGSDNKVETRQADNQRIDGLPCSIEISRGKGESLDEDFEPVDFNVSDISLSSSSLKERKQQDISNESNIRESKNNEWKKKKGVCNQEQTDPYRLLSEGGIVIGMTKVNNGLGEPNEKIYYISDDTHTLTIGATRSGKTRCLVLQSICIIGLAGESIIISDPKAELFHYTAGFLKKIGYEVIYIDFKSPEKSTRYNLLQPIIDAVNADDMEKAEMYAWDITNILVGDNTSNEKIWENGEKSIIAASILCVVVDNKNRPEYQNLTNVYWFIAEMSKPVGGKTPMQEYVKKLPANHPARALLAISDVAPSRTKSSFYTSALTTLRLFTGRSIYSITHRSDYNISDIGQKKQALFFILPDEKTSYYPIASLMISQLYELLVRQSDERGGRLKNRVNFILDEFGNFTKLTDFTNKLTVAGGRGIRFNLFLQSFEQLTEKYNKETAAIVKSNCQTWIYLQADDKETLQEICDKMGKYTTSAYQLSSQHGKYVNPSSSHSISLVARDLLTTDEIRRVARPHQIVVSRSHPAIMKAPDLTEWLFNRMCGLGDKEHNRKVREYREAGRPIISDGKEEIKLWNIWVYYYKDLQMKEERQRNQAMAAQAGSMFSEKLMRRGGMFNNEEED